MIYGETMAAFVDSYCTHCPLDHKSASVAFLGSLLACSFATWAACVDSDCTCCPLDHKVSSVGFLGRLFFCFMGCLF